MSLMNSRRRETIAELARQAGADPYPAWPRRFARALLRKWTQRSPAPVVSVGEDAPRDLDDPLSDPKAQARIGEVIARRARRPKQ